MRIFALAFSPRNFALYLAHRTLTELNKLKECLARWISYKDIFLRPQV